MAVAEVLLLDDDTIRTWHKRYEEAGLTSLAEFGYRGSAPRLDDTQRQRLRTWITNALPRTTREAGAWIEAEFGIVYDSRSGLVKLLHRLGMEHHRPKAIGRTLDPAKQAAFIASYEALLREMDGNEVVLFGDAVHPLHEVRPMGCWAPAHTKLAIQQTSGRDRLNVHGAIDLHTGQTCMLEAASVDAASTIRLLIALSAAYPNKRLIHVFLDNAATITPRWSKPGWPSVAAGSDCISSRPTAPTSTQSNDCGARCTNTSPTTDVTPALPSSSKPSWASCEMRCREPGLPFVIKSRIISVSLRVTIFGLWGEQSILSFKKEGLLF